jgi:beta-xylosidase
VSGTWTDSSLPLAERVEALLSEMTLEEKVAQLGSVWIGAHLSSGNEVAPMQEAFADPL